MKVRANRVYARIRNSMQPKFHNFKMVKVIPIMPIDVFYGKLNEKGKYYFRRSRKGIIYACRCPDRSGHKKTAAEAANQQHFAQTWGQRYKKQ